MLDLEKNKFKKSYISLTRHLVDLLIFIVLTRPNKVLEPMNKINIMNVSNVNTYANKSQVLKIWNEFKSSIEEAGK